MKALLKKFKKDEKGFTLIELLAVIVILAVIAAIAVPLISGIIKKSKDDADVATYRQVYDAARLYVTSELAGESKGKIIPVISATDTGGVTVGLQYQNYLDKNLVLPSTKNPITGGEVKYKSNGELLYVSLATTDGTKFLDGPSVLANKGTPSATAPTE